MGGCYAPLDRGSDREGCCATVANALHQAAPGALSVHPTGGLSVRRQCGAGEEAQGLEGGTVASETSSGRAPAGMGRSRRGWPPCGRGRGGASRSEGSCGTPLEAKGQPVLTETGRWDSQHQLGPAGSRGCQHHFLPCWERGPCQQQTPGEGGISSPKPGRPGLREASTPARASRPRHVEAPNCRRETQAGPVSPQPKIDPLFTPIHRHIKAGFMGTGARRVSQPDRGVRAAGPCPAAVGGSRLSCL